MIRAALALLASAALVRSKGATERGRTEHGLRHLPNLRAMYGRWLTDLHPLDFDYRILLLRPEFGKRRGKRLNLNRATTGLDWTDEGEALTGSLTLHRPDPQVPADIQAKRFQTVRLQCRWRKRWFTLWDMRIDAEPDTDLVSGTVSFALSDDLTALQRGEREWTYRKDKAHPNGWKAHQVAKDVARKLGVKLGRIAEGTELLDKIELKKGTGLEVIQEAYAQEREKTGIRYIIRLRNGRLDVVPFKRSRVLYIIKGVMTDGSHGGEAKEQRPRTVLEASGHVKDESGTRKLKLTVARKNIVERVGRVEFSHDFGRVESRAELVEKAKRMLARELRSTLTANLTIPMIPFLERGDTVRWITKEPGWHGPSEFSRDRSYAFLTAVTHTLSPGSMPRSAVTLSQRDPYLKDERRRAKEEREKKRRQRGRDGKGDRAAA